MSSDRIHLSVTEAREHSERALGGIGYAAEEARRITGDIIPSDNADEQVWIERVAHGVVVGLTAWNYPAALTTRKMGPALLALNKCPDFEVNRGHYFGTGQISGEPALSDSDKLALIEFLKTF